MKKWLLAAVCCLFMTAVLPACSESGKQDDFLRRRMAAGAHHFAAILADGRVAAAGENGDGQCGVDAWRDVIALAAGKSHTVGLRSDGTVVAAGRNDQGQCAVESWRDIVAVAAGSEHTVGLRADGTVAAAGCRAYVEESWWDEEEETYDPCDVEGWRDVVLLAAGGHTTFAVCRDGTVLIAGRQSDLTVWRDGEEESANGIRLPEIPRQIAVLGDETLLALYPDGTVDAWGYSAKLNPAEWERCSVCNPGIHRMVDGSRHTLSMWTDIVELGVSDSFVLGLKKDGSVVAAGDFAAPDAGFSLHGAEAWRNIVALAVGSDFAFGLDSTGQLHYAAQPVGDMGGVTPWRGIEKIAAAEGFAAGLDEKGNVVRWSAMEELELFYDGRLSGSWRDIRQLTASESILAGIDGQGRVLAAGVPEEWIEEIGRLRGAKQVSAAGDRLLVLSKTGEARLWAADAEEWDLLPLQGAAEAVLGQNGILARMPDGTARAAAAPGKETWDVADWDNLTAIAAAGEDAYGLTAEGRVLLTGPLIWGQREAAAWEGITALSASPYHVVGLKKDGTAVAAGLDENLEDDDRFDAWEAKYQCRVEGWRDVKEITAGTGCTIGVGADGRILLSGMGYVDASGALGWKILSAPYTRRDAPFQTDSENLRAIAARKAAYEENAARTKEFLFFLEPAARAVLDMHPEYDRMYNFHHGLAVFCRDGLYGLVDEAGREVLPARCSEINRARGAAVFYDAEQDLIGFYAEDTGVLIPAQFLRANDFEGEYAMVQNVQGEKCFVDRQGRIITPEEFEALNLPEWKAPAASLTPREGADGEGYENGAGEEVIPPIFDQVYEFECGLARVWLWGDTGVIDERGYAICGFEGTERRLQKNQEL